METYQTLSLIGCILGILLTVGLIGVTGALLIATDVVYNKTRPNATEQQDFETTKQTMFLFSGGVIIALLIYVAALAITFVVKTKVKLVGVLLLALGVIAMGITYFWGIIPFALLLPAGILAIRHKHQP